jgi:hypothetical protein
MSKYQARMNEKGITDAGVESALKCSLTCCWNIVHCIKSGKSITFYFESPSLNSLNFKSNER